MKKIVLLLCLVVLLTGCNIKTINDDKGLYENYELPQRKTKNSAGYDISSLIDYELAPGEKVLIPTGIKATFNPDEVLYLHIRSSLGFKHNIRLVNQVGIIDSDYYNNPDNEGHIMIKIQNEGEKPFNIVKGNAIAQGIFIKYLTIDNEEEILKERTGGIGSTDRSE